MVSVLREIFRTCRLRDLLADVVAVLCMCGLFYMLALIAVVFQ